ncbi:ComF family protein [Aureimonas psammosilenae]|uniref:ComF family protein n=1 Tax=Aureimonas psammosilenae TaxID=2495496 RepID=UPI002E273DA2
MRAALLYDEAAGRMASALKYGDRGELAPLMAGWMGRAGAELLIDADCVLPVPLHRFRLLRRRFNQSAELARRIAKADGRPYRPLALVRTRHTRRQVGLGSTQRRDNVRGAFLVPEKHRAAIRDKRVLLVDDVFTTGATIDAATLALLRGGAKAVDVLVFARVAGPS